MEAEVFFSCQGRVKVLGACFPVGVGVFLVPADCEVLRAASHVGGGFHADRCASFNRFLVVTTKCLLRIVSVHMSLSLHRSSDNHNEPR